MANRVLRDYAYLPCTILVSQALIVRKTRLVRLVFASLKGLTVALSTVIVDRMRHVVLVPAYRPFYPLVPPILTVAATTFADSGSVCLRFSPRARARAIAIQARVARPAYAFRRSIPRAVQTRIVPVFFRAETEHAFPISLANALHNPIAATMKVVFRGCVCPIHWPVAQATPIVEAISFAGLTSASLSSLLDALPMGTVLAATSARPGYASPLPSMAAPQAPIVLRA